MDDKELKQNTIGNYSKDHGKFIGSIKNDDFVLKNDKICEYCEEENKIKDNYCKNCGARLYEASRVDKIKDKNKLKLDIRKNMKNIEVSKVLLTSITTIGILLIIGILFKGTINKALGQASGLINPLHIVLGMNFGIIDIQSSSMMGQMNINMSLGIILLLICPIIALSISNLIFMKKADKSTKGIIINSLGVGISYGLILGIISIFTSVRGSSYDMIKYGFSIGYSFEFLSVIINGSVLGFLCTFIIGLKKNANYENKYIQIMKMALKTVAIGCILILIIFIVLNKNNNSYLHELGVFKYSGTVTMVGVLMQLAVYVWAFANLIPVTIGSTTVSIFSIGGNYLFTDTKLIFLAILAMSALIILVSGIKIRSKYSEPGIKPVIFFSISYSIIMTVLALFTTIFVGGNYIDTIAMGFNPMLTMVISFVYSFVIGLAGYKLSEVN